MIAPSADDLPSYRVNSDARKCLSSGNVWLFLVTYEQPCVSDV